jgi:superfamily II DNA or RNA helicase
LCKKQNGEYEYIQCKNYSTLGIDNTITINDLSGFYNFVAENTIQNPVVYYSGVLSSQIQCRKKKIKYINLPYIKIGNKDIKPRDYQIEAIQKLNQNWNGIKSLILPCGTGKTIIFNEYLKQNNFKNIFIFSPLTTLTEQNLDNIKKYIANYNHILVDVNGTRDFNVVKDNLNKYSIFSSTFKSAEEIISKLFDLEENCILENETILIVDEAHNLLNLNNLNKTIKNFKKVLLVTATPPSDMEDIIPNEIIYK